MHEHHIFLEKTWCILNEKMMSDATVMVPEIEIDNKYGKSAFRGQKCGGTPVLHIDQDGYKIDTGIYREVCKQQ
jgi:hypothetical protein